MLCLTACNYPTTHKWRSENDSISEKLKWQGLANTARGKKQVSEFNKRYKKKEEQKQKATVQKKKGMGCSHPSKCSLLQSTNDGEDEAEVEA